MRYIVAIADEGGFQAAADVLHIAQPPLSRQVRHLEAALEVELFYRRPTRLTDAGRTFVDGARRILADVDALVRSVQHAGRDTVRLGYTLTAACEDHILTRLIATLREAHPHVEVEGRELWEGELLAGLHDGELDVGIAWGLPQGTGLEELTLREAPVAAALRDSHPHARKHQISLRDLQDETFRFIPRRQAPSLYDVVTNAIAAAGVTVNIWENPTPALRGCAVHDLGGFTIVPYAQTQHLPTGITAVPLTDSFPRVGISLAWRSGLLTPATDSLIQAGRRLSLNQEDDDG